MSEQRKAYRTNLMVKVEVSWRDGSGTNVRAGGRVEDESIGGVCVRVPKPLAVGLKLEIHADGTQRSGVVRRCERDHGAFVVGVEWDGGR